MAKKNNLFRMKFEFENIPIMDVRKSIRDEKEFDDILGNVKKKIFGGLR